MQETINKKHCGDCMSFKPRRPGRKRGTCESRPADALSALYASGNICNRFIPKH